MRDAACMDMAGGSAEAAAAKFVKNIEDPRAANAAVSSVRIISCKNEGITQIFLNFNVLWRWKQRHSVTNLVDTMAALGPRHPHVVLNES